MAKNVKFCSTKNGLKFIKIRTFVDCNYSICYSKYIEITEQEGSQKKEMVIMLLDQICDLRDKLNKSILTEDFESTYELSIKLDELIAEYYKQCLIQ